MKATNKDKISMIIWDTTNKNVNLALVDFKNQKMTAKTIAYQMNGLELLGAFYSDTQFYIPVSS